MNFALRLPRVLETTLFSFVARILCGKYILFTQVFSRKLLFYELFHESCRNIVILKESLSLKNMNFRVSCIWILITDTWKLLQRTFRKKMTSNLRAVFNNSVFPFDFPNFSLMLEVVQVPAARHHHPPQCLDNSPKLIFAAAVGGGWWLHHRLLLPSVNTAAGGPAPPPNPSFSLHSVCL